MKQHYNAVTASNQKNGTKRLRRSRYVQRLHCSLKAWGQRRKETKKHAQRHHGNWKETMDGESLLVTHAAVSRGADTNEERRRARRINDVSHHETRP